MSRRIIVELTEAEYGSLASAVALAECNWEQDHGARGVKTLLAAWSKINRAWHADSSAQAKRNVKPMPKNARK